MKHKPFSLQFFSLLIAFQLMCISVSAQYKSFNLTQDGDTVNITDKKGLKQGKWIITVGELRGEPGYDEEGLYKNDKKEGVWRKYTSQGDLLAIENYRFGGKEGLQQYYSFLGTITKEEEWHSYNPDAPYDTIPIYGAENNQIIEYKVVKATQYSVPHGIWKYYDGGRVTKVEKYDRGMLQKDTDDKSVATTDKPAEDKPKAKQKEKPQEVLQYEKKYSQKKRTHMERVGKTSL